MVLLLILAVAIIFYPLVHNWCLWGENEMTREHVNLFPLDCRVESSLPIVSQSNFPLDPPGPCRKQNVQQTDKKRPPIILFKWSNFIATNPTTSMPASISFYLFISVSSLFLGGRAIGFRVFISPRPRFMWRNLKYEKFRLVSFLLKIAFIILFMRQ